MDSSFASWMKPQVLSRMCVASAGSSTIARPPRHPRARTEDSAVGVVLGAAQGVDVYPRPRSRPWDPILLAAFDAGLCDEKGPAGAARVYDLPSRTQ